MSNYKTEIKWALIFAAMGLIWMLLERLVGLHDTHIDKHPIYTNLIAVPAIAIYVFALLDKRKNDLGGIMTFKQGLITGLIITAIVTLLSPLTQYITSTLITPEYFNNAITYSVETGKVTQEDAEGFFNLRNYIMMGLMSAPIMGLVTSLVVAFFTKKTE